MCNSENTATSTHYMPRIFSAACKAKQTFLGQATIVRVTIFQFSKRGSLRFRKRGRKQDLYIGNFLLMVNDEGVTSRNDDMAPPTVNRSTTWNPRHRENIHMKVSTLVLRTGFAKLAVVNSRGPNV